VWLAVLLQATLLSGLGIASPDLVLVVVVVVALLRGPVVGSVVGFGAGLLLDVTTISPVMGITSLVLATTGYWAGRYGETTGRDRRHAPYLSVAVATVLATLATVALRFVLQQSESAPRALFHQLPPRLLLGVLLTAPLFRLARRVLRRRGMLERTAEVRLLG
jgi:rod shape-determining protein MreD